MLKTIMLQIKKARANKIRIVSMRKVLPRMGWLLSKMLSKRHIRRTKEDESARQILTKGVENRKTTSQPRFASSACASSLYTSISKKT